jgi:hypothetical protein
MSAPYQRTGYLDDDGMWNRHKRRMAEFYTTFSKYHYRN